ncbi:MAG: hypothetical protein QG583_14 [Patescibacteria group bacterium]|nr:hypothetical protein [Patescibacteria group bacterium]
MIITLPRYWDQEVILARGHCNRVYLYLVQDFNKLKEEIEERKVKYGTRYEAFRKFVDMGQAPERR